MISRHFRRFLLFKKAPSADLDDLPMKTDFRFEYLMLVMAIPLLVLLVAFIWKQLAH